MMQWNTKYLLGLAFLMFAFSCAQIGVPGGGLDDTTPPFIVREGSTANSQTNFTDRKIELSFNEWITVKNTSKEVFVSPPLDYPLQVTDRGKKVIVEFNEKEVLQENTTYQISFGKSIVDLTANNELENYIFLFSTGDKLDILSVEGIVIDNTTQEPVKDVIVLLHDNLADTSFTTLKPTYITRTDEEGAFKLQNLRADTFEIFGLIDGNVSYTYDLQTEQVAFLDSLVVLTDSMAPLKGIKLELFDEDDEALLLEARQKQQGLVKIIYNPKPRNSSVFVLGDEEAKTFTEFKKDTLLLWHQLQDSLRLKISHDDGIDTVKVRAAKKSISRMAMTTQAKSLKLLKTDSIKVVWSKPIASIDTSLISLSDTTGVYNYTAGYYDKTLWLLGDLASNRSYSLVIDTSAVTDWYGLQSVDSNSIDIKTLDPEDLGTINLSVVKEDTVSYIIELRSTERLIETWTILESEKMIITGLEPGVYRIVITQDSNGDGRLSSGVLSEKKKPELKKDQTLEALKSGWELETTIDITELFYGTTGG